MTIDTEYQVAIEPHEYYYHRRWHYIATTTTLFPPDLGKSRITRFSNAIIIAMCKDSCQPRAFSSFVELQNINYPADEKHPVRVLVAFSMEPERPVKATVSYEMVTKIKA